jgi:hypothetical protein
LAYWKLPAHLGSWRLVQKGGVLGSLASIIWFCFSWVLGFSPLPLRLPLFLSVCWFEIDIVSCSSAVLRDVSKAGANAEFFLSPLQYQVACSRPTNSARLQHFEISAAKSQRLPRFCPKATFLLIKEGKTWIFAIKSLKNVVLQIGGNSPVPSS